MGEEREAHLLPLSWDHKVLVHEPCSLSSLTCWPDVQLQYRTPKTGGRATGGQESGSYLEQSPLSPHPTSPFSTCTGLGSGGATDLSGQDLVLSVMMRSLLWLTKPPNTVSYGFLLGLDHKQYSLMDSFPEWLYSKCQLTEQDTFSRFTTDISFNFSEWCCNTL